VESEESIPAAIIVVLYGYWDFAVEIMKRYGDSDLLEGLLTALMKK
jgi:hypothetical protein